GLERAVTVGLVVEHLDLDARAVAMMVAVLGHADIDAAVAACFELVLEAEIKVAVLILAPQPGAFLAGADDRAVLDLPAFLGRLARAYPAGERLAVKQWLVA